MEIAGISNEAGLAMIQRLDVNIEYGYVFSW